MTKQLLVVFLLVGIIFLRVFSFGWGEEGQKSLDFVPEGGFFQELRDSLSSQINYLLPSPQAGLLSGMLLGQKEALPFDFRKALTNTSTIHIVVASGQNLSLLAGFLMGLGLVSILGRKKTVLMALGATLFYALLTGFQIPIIRAWIMFFFASLAQLFNREEEGGFILVVTALIMVLINPTWASSISFQLSFLATLAVVVVAPVLMERVKFLPDIIREDLIVSLSASLLTYPVIAINFYQLSLVGILVNSLILWTVGLVMVTGLVALLGSFLNLFLGQMLALIPGVLLTYFVYIIEFFNSLFRPILVPNLSPLFWVGYYFLLAGIFLWIKKIPRDKDSKVNIR
jgi:competence protein ComEC